MTKIDDFIQAISDGVLVETDEIEFKKSIPQNISRLAKTIAGMSNTHGGYIIFGIANNSHGLSIIGIDLTPDFTERLQKLDDLLSIKTYTFEQYKVKNKNIIIFTISKSEYPVYVRNNADSERLYKYIRIGVDTQVATSVNDSGNENEHSKLYTRVFKYMNLESFLCSLYGKSLRFSEPSSWPDRYETRFYCANYSNIANNECAKRLFATCVTRTRNNEAAWKVYARNGGLSTHCVQLELDITGFRHQLRNNNYHVEERSMEYTSEDYILNLHKRSSKYYSRYFTPFTSESYLKLLTLKRDAYQYENEIRLFIIPSENGEREIEQKKATFIDISIEWDKIIKSVRVDKKCSQAELISIIQACHYANINPIFKVSAISVSIPAVEHGSDIPFDLYDIDEMPDNRQITIEE